MHRPVLWNLHFTEKYVLYSALTCTYQVHCNLSQTLQCRSCQVQPTLSSSCIMLLCTVLLCIELSCTVLLCTVQLCTELNGPELYCYIYKRWEFSKRIQALDHFETTQAIQWVTLIVPWFLCNTTILVFLTCTHISKQVYLQIHQLIGLKCDTLQSEIFQFARMMIKSIGFVTDGS